MQQVSDARASRNIPVQDTRKLGSVVEEYSGETDLNIVVKFHSDGGQMCGEGTRVFPLKNWRQAQRFADEEAVRDQHKCHNSVQVSLSSEQVRDAGELYPNLANWVRDLPEPALRRREPEGLLVTPQPKPPVVENLTMWAERMRPQAEAESSALGKFRHLARRIFGFA